MPLKVAPSPLCGTSRFAIVEFTRMYDKALHLECISGKKTPVIVLEWLSLILVEVCAT